MVSEKEFAVINEIYNNHLPDQRTIASRAGISLGLVNLIIKRLISKGYIKAKQLDKKKIQYLLTPKGFAEKADKSYRFAIKTIQILKIVRKSIQTLLELKYNDGYRDFILIGSGELADITEMACKKIRGLNLLIEKQAQNIENDSVQIKLKKENGSTETIDLLKYISENGIGF